MPSYIAKVQAGQEIETLFLTAVDDEDARAQAYRAGNVINVKKKFSMGGANRLSRADRLILIQRLATMIGSKMGAAESLRLLSETFTGQISHVSGELAKRIEAGRSLIQAMEDVGPSAFPEAVLAIIRTGAQAGNMAFVLQEAVQFERELNSLKSESSKGLWSAGVGFLAGVAVLLSTTLYLVPEMEGNLMVQQLGGGQLPWVVLMGDIMTWMAILVSVIVALYLILTKLVRLAKPAEVDRLVVYIPFVRDIVLAARNYVAFYGLSVLLKAGLRVEDALKIAYNSASRGQIKEDFKAAINAVRTGQPWAMTMQSLHPTDRAALATSQNREQVATAMGYISDQYRSIYKTRIEQMVPVTQMFSALFLTASGVLMFGAIIIPMLEMTRVAMEMA